MKFQLLMLDEYGSSSILGSNSDLATLVKQAKGLVNELNVNNALSSAEKQRNWEAMYVDLVDVDSGDPVTDAVFSGKDNSGQWAIQPLGADKSLVKFAQCAVKPRIYLGILDRKDWYAADERGNEINDLKHATVQGKIVYFVRRIS